MLGVGRGEKGRKGATGWLAVPTASPKLPLSKKMQAARLSSVNGFLEVMKTQWGKKPPPCMPSPPPPPRARLFKLLLLDLPKHRRQMGYRKLPSSAT